MSLVGPGAALPGEADLYGSYVQRRLVVKPGITGLWQVSRRSDLPWDEAVRLDLRYVETGHSPWTCKYSGRPGRQCSRALAPARGR